MKKKTIAIAVALLTSGGIAVAQEIPQSQVPSLVINSFKQNFSEATDVEWEIKGENYKVEFDTGWFTDDQEAWFDKSGKLLRHEEEVAESKLPEAVRSVVKSEYAGYRIDDAEKITTGGKAVYRLELDSKDGDVDILLDANGRKVDNSSGTQF